MQISSRKREKRALLINDGRISLSVAKISPYKSNPIKKAFTEHILQMNEWMTKWLYQKKKWKATAMFS